MTMSPDEGGVFDALLGLVRLGLGGSAGTGRQFVSWIHYEDFVAAVRWLIQRRDIDGAVNLAASARRLIGLMEELEIGPKPPQRSAQ